MAGIFEMTDSWTDGEVEYSSIKMTATNTASESDTTLLTLETIDTGVLNKRFSVGKEGDVFISGDATVGGSLSATSLSASDSINGVDITSSGEISCQTFNCSSTANFSSNVTVASTLEAASIVCTGIIEVPNISNTGSITIGPQNAGDELTLNGTNISLNSVTGEKFMNMDVNAGIQMFYDDVQALAVTSDGIQVDGNIQMNDNRELQFGNVDDLIIRHNGGDSEIIDQGTGNLFIRGSAGVVITNPAGDRDFARFLDNGQCLLYNDGDLKLQTVGIGIQITGRVTSDSLSVGSVLYPTADGTAGQVLATDGAGTLSFTTASGFDPNTNTPAIGNNAAATGTFSSAYGVNSTASGAFSAAIGGAAEATGTNNVSLGYNATSTGSTNAIAVGRDSQALGTDSISIGQGSVGSQQGSIALGDASNSQGLGTVAIGQQASAAGSASAGYGVAVGTEATVVTAAERGVAVGYQADVNASDATSIGNRAVTNGDGSIAMGVLATANGNLGIAIGQQSEVLGANGISIGYLSSTASGGNAVAIGERANAQASGVAIGSNVNTTSSNAVAIGHDTDANGSASVAIGDNANTAASAGFGIAIGDNANANAASTMHINSSGVSTNAPTVAGDIEIQSTTGRLTWDTTATNWLMRGGDLHVESDVVAFSATISDARLKSNVVEVPNALDKIDQLRGVTFTYTGGRESAGVIAQEVEAVLPCAVTERLVPLEKGADEETKYKTVNYDALSSLFIEAIKELKAENEALTARIAVLEA